MRTAIRKEHGHKSGIKATCMSTGKTKFRKMKQALTIMNRYNAEDPSKVLSIYTCPICRYFHLTTIDKKQNKQHGLDRLNELLKMKGVTYDG